MPHTVLRVLLELISFDIGSIWGRGRRLQRRQFDKRRQREAGLGWARSWKTWV